MRIEIPKNTLHREIHNKISGVPLPDEKEIKRAIRHLDALKEAGAICDKDGIEKRLAIIIPMFTSQHSGGFLSAFTRMFQVANDFYHPKKRRRKHSI